MLQLVGETRGQYLHIECEACGNAVALTNLRWVGGVPQVEALCANCDESADLKLHPPTWVDALPMES